MTLKLCPSCKTQQTTKNALFKGRVGGLLWFNCKTCMTTFILRPKMLTSILIMFLSSTLTSCGKKDVTTFQGYKFLVVGQSNSVSPAQGTLSSVYSKTGSVVINDYYITGNCGCGDNLEPQIFRTPTKEAPMQGGVAWVMLGDLLNQPSIFNVIGRGNTSTRRWRNELYVRILKALREDSYTAVLWVQGESDAAERISSDESYSNLKFVIEEANKVRKVPWYVALDGCGQCAGLSTYDGPARIAQLQIIKEGLALQGPDIDLLRERPEFFEASFAEFSNVEGFEAHAKAWANVLKLN